MGNFWIRFSSLAFLIGILLFVLAQAPLPERKSQILAELSACTTPCWRTIQPGITTNEEVVQVVKHMETSRLLIYHDWSLDYLHSIKYLNGKDYYVTVRTVDELAFAIYRSIPEDLRVQDYIMVLGQPELLLQPLTEKKDLEWIWDDQLSCADVTSDNIYPPHPEWYEILLVYPSKGVVIFAIRAPWFLDTVCPEFLISRIHYYEPGLLSEETSAMNHPRLGIRVEEFQEYEWLGYGSYYGFEVLE